MKNYYNVHTHVFNEACVPSGFYGRKARRLIDRITLFPSVRNFFAAALRAINPFNQYDKGNALANLVMQVTHDTQEEVLLELLEHYRNFPNMKFVVLSLDMDFMQGGESLINYPTQLYELINLKYKYREKIVPFICADPRRYQGKELKEHVQLHIEQKEFSGIKLYPALGFYPFDPALFELYDYANANRIPIITHCDTGGIYFRGELSASHLKPQRLIHHPNSALRTGGQPGNNTLLGDLLAKSPYTETDSVAFKNNFSDPMNFREVLTLFPDLKICFAHFGGSEQITASVKQKERTWFDEIKFLMERFNHVYADISYTLHDTALTEILIETIEKHRSRVLFGTDFFLVSRERSEIDIVTDFKEALDRRDIELFDIIAADNPQLFLTSSVPTKPHNL